MYAFPTLTMNTSANTDLTDLKRYYNGFGRSPPSTFCKAKHITFRRNISHAAGVYRIASVIFHFDIWRRQIPIGRVGRSSSRARILSVPRNAFMRSLQPFFLTKGYPNNYRFAIPQKFVRNLFYLHSSYIGWINISSFKKTVDNQKTALPEPEKERVKRNFLFYCLFTVILSGR